MLPLNLPIGYDVLADAVDGHSGKAVELALTVAVLAELLDEDAIGVEDLNAVVAGVGDHDAIIGADGQAAWPCEGSGLAPPAPQLEQLLALAQVYLFRDSTCRSGYTGCCHCCCYRRGRRGA